MQPELLAHHLDLSDVRERAIPWWLKAGRRALHRSAYLEGIAHLKQGLAMLATLPETAEHRQQELDFQVALGSALMSSKGFTDPEVETTYARARELCRELGDTPQLFPVLRGLISYHLQLGRMQTAQQLADQLVRLAQPNTIHRLLAHYMVGMVSFFRGELASARTHHEHALTIYRLQSDQALASRYGIDLGVASLCYLAWELWTLGYVDQSLDRIQKALAIAKEISHPFSVTHTLIYLAVLHQHRREASAAYEQAEAATNLATQQGFVTWTARGTVLRGWARTIRENEMAGISEIRRGLSAEAYAKAMTIQPYFLGLLADAYREIDSIDESLTSLNEALALVKTTKARFYSAELYRLLGELHQSLEVPDSHRAEAYFQQSLDIARQQQAKSWELRAATSLARLWQSQDKRREAHDLLATVYNWFTEGFDTADLKDAKALLDDLA